MLRTVETLIVFACLSLLFATACKPSSAAERERLDLKGALVITDASELQLVLPALELAPVPAGSAHRKMTSSEFKAALDTALETSFRNCALKHLGTDDPMTLEELLRVGSDGELGSVDPEDLKAYFVCLSAALHGQR